MVDLWILFQMRHVLHIAMEYTSISADSTITICSIVILLQPEYYNTIVMLKSAAMVKSAEIKVYFSTICEICRIQNCIHQCTMELLNPRSR